MNEDWREIEREKIKNKKWQHKTQTLQHKQYMQRSMERMSRLLFIKWWGYPGITKDLIQSLYLAFVKTWCKTIENSIMCISAIKKLLFFILMYRPWCAILHANPHGLYKDALWDLFLIKQKQKQD